MSRPGFVKLRADGGWRGRVRRDSDAVWPALRAWFEGGGGELLVDRPSRRVARLESEAGTVYAKLTLRRSDETRGWTSRFDLLRFRLRPPRAYSIWKTTRALRAAGLSAPGVLVAAWRRVGLQTHNLIAFEPAPGRTLLDWLIDDVSAGRGEAGWRPWVEQFARETHRLHAAGFIHGDLLPGNVMAESPGSALWLLDNDRTRRWLVPPPASRRRRNLVQACTSLRVAFGWRLARRFLLAYSAAAGHSPAAARRTRRHVARRVKRRIDDRREELRDAGLPVPHYKPGRGPGELPPTDTPAPFARRLVFLSGHVEAASTRYRCLAFFPRLRESGWRVLHRSTRSEPSAWVAIWREVRAADVVVSHRRAFNAPTRWALRRTAKRLVFDFDDAIYARPEGESPGRRRGFHRICGVADEVWAGSDHLAGEASKHTPAERVHLLPTVLDPTRYTVKPEHRGAGNRLVWIGSSATRPYIEALMPTLERAAARVPGLRLTVVADFALRSGVMDVRAVPWSSATEASALAEADVGVGPLPDTPWTRGKCGFKVIQYMAAGLPVLADPIGANAVLIEDGVTGLLPATPDAWVEAIARLADDAALRGRLGAAGRRRCEEKYSLSAVFPVMLERLDALARSSHV